MKIVVIAGCDWPKVSDLLFIDGKYAPEVLGIESAWTWPFRIAFTSESAADTFIALAKEAGVEVTTDC